MTSFLLLCSSGAPKDDIYKLQQDKYYLANEKKSNIYSGSIQRGCGASLLKIFKS